MVFAILQHVTLYSSAEFMVCSESGFFPVAMEISKLVFLHVTH